MGGCPGYDFLPILTCAIRIPSPPRVDPDGGVTPSKRRSHERPMDHRPDPKTESPESRDPGGTSAEGEAGDARDPAHLAGLLVMAGTPLVLGVAVWAVLRALSG